MAEARKVIQMTSAQRKRAESAIAETNAMLQGLWSGVRFAKGPKVYGLPKGVTKLLGERKPVQRKVSIRKRRRAIPVRA